MRDLSTGKKPNFFFLDGVRGLSALYVLLHHIMLSSYPKISENPCGICVDAPAWAGWLRWGQLGVVVFIVVSGFSLALSPIKNGYTFPFGFRGYIARRAFRILPPYWVALAFSCLVVAFLTGNHTGNYVNTKAIVVHGLLVNNIIDSPKPNGPFWSIAVEWQIYFIFPLLLALCRRNGPISMACIASAAAIAAFFLATQHAWFASTLGLQPNTLSFLSKLLHLTPQFLALFAFGVAAAHIVSITDGMARLPWNKVGLALVLVTLLLLWQQPVATIEANWFWIDLIAGAAVAASLAGFVQHPNAWFARALGGTLPKWLGQSSYSLYLLHAPIIEMVSLMMVSLLDIDSNTLFFALLASVVPTAIMASRISWRIFELPFKDRDSFKGIRWSPIQASTWTRPSSRLICSLRQMRWCSLRKLP